MTPSTPHYGPDHDGQTHINVYSAGKTALGRALSNFSRCPIGTAHGPFTSIEGYLYWLRTPEHPRREELRVLHGLEAKRTRSILVTALRPHASKPGRCHSR